MRNGVTAYRSVGVNPSPLRGEVRESLCNLGLRSSFDCAQDREPIERWVLGTETRTPADYRGEPLRATGFLQPDS